MIIDQIMELIRTGKLKKGDKLPSERELSKELNVGRTSLKQAISSLASMGVIESRHGEGNFISDKVNVDLRIPFTAQFFLSDCKITDLVQIRYMIESQVVHVLSKSAEEEQLSELEQIVESMREVSDSESRAEINMVFHKKLVDMLGNELLSNIYDGISSLIAHQVKMADGVDFYQNHLALLNALKAKDSEACSRLIKDHFRLKYDEMDENFFRFFH